MVLQHEILKACLVWWLVKLHFFHYYWPRYERGGNRTQWLMPISLHKSFPNSTVLFVPFSYQVASRPKSSAKCTLFQGRQAAKKISSADWKQQKFSCWREKEHENWNPSISCANSYHNFHMKYLLFTLLRLCNWFWSFFKEKPSSKQSVKLQIECTAEKGLDLWVKPASRIGSDVLKFVTWGDICSGL